MRIVVLGGYGETGKVLCRYLLQETDADLVVAGRNGSAAEEYANELGAHFPPGRISSCAVDAADRADLERAFQGADFVLVAATTTACAVQIAEAALAAECDYLDIYFQQDVYPALAALNERCVLAGRTCITQAGFHPGLPAAYVRAGAEYFDRYDSALVAFAFHLRVRMSDSVLELVDAVADYHPLFFSNGRWRTATYKDARKIDFGPGEGVRQCMPLEMAEIHPLPETYGLREVAVLTTGFNAFVDYLLFPLMTLSYSIRKGLLRRFWARALVWGINTFSPKKSGVVFLLQAEGEKAGRRRRVRIVSEYADAYDFTAIAVVACLKQLFAGRINKPGMWMMGHVVETERLFQDMEAMGVRTRIEESDL